MSFRRGLAVSKEHYNKLLAIQIANNSPYREHFVGSRKSIVLGGVPLATHVVESNLDIGDLTNQQFGSFIGRFNKQLYKQFSKKPELHDLNISPLGVARDKNHILFSEMEVGEAFYNVDLSSAYWQIGYRLGYINEKMFLRYLPDDSYKPVKRYCVSFLSRKNEMANPDGTLIKCDQSVLTNVYQNIRHELYNTIFNVADLVSEYIEYNIDGISVRADQLELVKQYFDSEGLHFKITRCRKISEKQFYYGSKQRKFKK
jgi:hypothetical protein